MAGVDRSAAISTAAAFAVALFGIFSMVLLIDPTPLLAEPRPDLDLPLGLIGIAAGLWAASRITSLPYARRRWGRWALWIMLPLWLGFGIPVSAERLREAFSFRNGGSLEEATVLLIGKERSTTRRGGDLFDATLVNPLDEESFDLRIDEITFKRIEPGRECVTLLLERASNGAVRLVRPVQWKVRCPWVDG